MADFTEKEILFVINPNSGRKNPKPILKKILQQFPKAQYIISPSPEVFHDYMRQNVEKYHVLVAIGGDGTIRSLLPYLKNSERILSILPQGSGNGFARELGFSKNIQKLKQVIQNGETRSVDLLKINDNNCLNVSGIGFDSHVAHSFAKEKVRGLATYIRVAIYQYLKFKTFEATIHINGEKFTGNYFMVSIANTRQFGNNAYISPLSQPDDGRFEIMLMKPLPILLAPFFAVRLFTGSLHKTRFIDYHQSSERVKISTSTHKLHIDGDPERINGEISIHIEPHSIRVFQTKF